MPVDRLRLLKTPTKPSVYLADGDFDLWVFCGVFKIAIAVDPAIDAHFILIVDARLFPKSAKPSKNLETTKGSARRQAFFHEKLIHSQRSPRYARMCLGWELLPSGVLN